MAELVELATNNGIAIVGCIALAFFCKYIYDTMLEQMKKTISSYEKVIKNQDKFNAEILEVITNLTEEIKKMEERHNE